MNLLCPNCQKMLTIGEQYAGQMMRCPLCSGTFLVPSLAPAQMAVGGSDPAHETAAYGLADEPPAASSKPEDVISAKTAPSEPPPEQRPPTPPAGYTHTHGHALNRHVLPWIAPTCLGLVFIFTFFNWDGLYPGGYGVYTQSYWGGLVSGFSADPVGEKVLQAEQPLTENMRVSWVFWLFLPVFLVALVLAIASVAVPRLQIKLPLHVQQVMPWKSAVIGGLAALALVLLLFQLLLGLGLENAVDRMVSKELEPAATQATTAEDHQKLAIEKGMAIDRFNPGRGFGLRATVFLFLVAIAGAGLDFWMEQRGNRPAPRVAVYW